MSKTKVLTPKFRVSFANVFKPRHNDLNGKDEYSLVALFAKGENLKPLEDAIEAAMVEKFGENKAKWPSNWKNPLRDQADRKKDGVMPEGYVEGAKYLNLKSTTKPGVVNKDVQDIIDASEFYSGCYARASVNAYAYDQKGNRGVSFGLGNIQKMSEGEPFSGRTKPTDDFAPIQDDSSSKDATALFN